MLAFQDSTLDWLDQYFCSTKGIFKLFGSLGVVSSLNGQEDVLTSSINSEEICDLFSTKSKLADRNLFFCKIKSTSDLVTSCRGIFP
jgi:hypothetical protein